MKLQPPTLKFAISMGEDAGLKLVPDACMGVVVCSMPGMSAIPGMLAMPLMPPCAHSAGAASKIVRMKRIRTPVINGCERTTSRDVWRRCGIRYEERVAAMAVADEWTRAREAERRRLRAGSRAS